MNSPVPPSPIEFKELSDGSTFLHASQWVPRPLDQVFRFFSQPENLQSLTPTNMKFQLLTKPPVEMEEGLELDYKLRVKGIPMGWTSKITLWDPPHAFSDIQLKGPYKSWDHTHRFSQDGSGTRVVDEVFYHAPGPRWVERMVVRPDIERIFQFRHLTLEELLLGASSHFA